MRAALFVIGVTCSMDSESATNWHCKAITVVREEYGEVLTPAVGDGGASLQRSFPNRSAAPRFALGGKRWSYWALSFEQLALL